MGNDNRDLYEYYSRIELQDSKEALRELQSMLQEKSIDYVRMLRVVNRGLRSWRDREE